MKHTQFVLNESEFFLKKLEEEKENYAYFSYYLNAYISAARSVLWIMKNEYNKVAGWKEWYNSTDIDKEKALLLKGIVDMRNRSLKIEPLQIKQEFLIGDENTKFNLYDEIEPFVGKKISFTIEDTGKKEKARRTSDGNSLTLTGKLTPILTVREFKNKDILEVCQQYFDWLNETVETCIRKFG